MEKSLLRFSSDLLLRFSGSLVANAVLRIDKTERRIGVVVSGLVVCVCVRQSLLAAILCGMRSVASFDSLLQYANVPLPTLSGFLT